MEIQARVWKTAIECTCIYRNEELVEFTIPLNGSISQTIRKYFDGYLIRTTFLYMDQLNNQVYCIDVTNDFVPSTYIRRMEDA